MLAVPLYMLQVYDRVLVSGSIETLIMLTALCAGLLLTMGLVSAARSWLLNDVSSKLNQKLGPKLFDKTVLNANPSSSTNLGKLNELRQFITSPGATALLDFPFSPIFFAALFVIHPYFGVISLGGAAVILLMVAISDWATRKLINQSSQLSAEANKMAQSFSRDAAAARTMGMSKYVNQIWREWNGDAVETQLIAADRTSFVTALTKFTRLFLQMAVLGVGAWLTINQETSAGAMIAASIIMGRALAPIDAIIGSWRMLIKSAGAYKELKGFAESIELKRNEHHTVLPAPKGNIDVKNLTFVGQRDEPPILEDVSFSLQAGSSLGIVGASGSGKSTLARILVGDLVPTEGSVRLDRTELSSWPREELGPYIGYIPQDVNLMSGTVGQNISRFVIPSSEAEAEKVNADIIAAAQGADAHEMISALPKAYDTPVGESGRLLSGGQRQRIALARAIYGDVRCVILDEPNASLDTAGEQALSRTIDRLKDQGVTVIVISHKLPIIRQLDQMIVLNAGSVVARGPTFDVLNNIQSAASVSNKSTPQMRSNIHDQTKPSAAAQERMRRSSIRTNVSAS